MYNHGKEYRPIGGGVGLEVDRFHNYDPYVNKRSHNENTYTTMNIDRYSQFNRGNFNVDFPPLPHYQIDNNQAIDLTKQSTSNNQMIHPHQQSSSNYRRPTINTGFLPPLLNLNVPVKPYYVVQLRRINNNMRGLNKDNYRRHDVDKCMELINAPTLHTHKQPTLLDDLSRHVQLTHHLHNWKDVPESLDSRFNEFAADVNPPLRDVVFQNVLNNVCCAFKGALVDAVQQHLVRQRTVIEERLKICDVSREWLYETKQKTIQRMKQRKGKGLTYDIEYLNNVIKSVGTKRLSTEVIVEPMDTGLIPSTSTLPSATSTTPTSIPTYPSLPNTSTPASSTCTLLPVNLILSTEVNKIRDPRLRKQRPAALTDPLPSPHGQSPSISKRQLFDTPLLTNTASKRKYSETKTLPSTKSDLKESKVKNQLDLSPTTPLGKEANFDFDSDLEDSSIIEPTIILKSTESYSPNHSTIPPLSPTLRLVISQESNNLSPHHSSPSTSLDSSLSIPSDRSIMATTSAYPNTTESISTTQNNMTIIAVEAVDSVVPLKNQLTVHTKCDDCTFSISEIVSNIIIGSSNLRHIDLVELPAATHVICIPGAGLRFLTTVLERLLLGRMFFQSLDNIVVVGGFNDMDCATVPPIVPLLNVLDRFTNVKCFFMAVSFNPARLSTKQITNLTYINNKALLRRYCIQPVPSPTFATDIHYDTLTLLHIIRKITKTIQDFQ